MELSRRGFIGVLTAIPAVKVVRLFEARYDTKVAPDGPALMISSILSPDGMSFNFTQPVYIPPGTAVLVEVVDGKLTIDTVKRNA